jgi:hypothetical protein
VEVFNQRVVLQHEPAMVKPLDGRTLERARELAASLSDAELNKELSDANACRSLRPEAYT